jgi:hypothetical protein
MANIPLRFIRRLIWLAVVIFLLAPSTWTVQAGPLTPRAPETPSRPPEEFQPASQPARQTAALAGLPPLKAVLIVGPIDGDYGEWTNAEKANMDLAAGELSANGVAVHKFYAPNNNWAQIKAAAQGAHFLMYRGHGVYWSDYPNPIVGGFALHDSFISSDQIRSDLELAPNAIVMLYGCFTAGSSSSDPGSISLEEARRRVAMYSDPFLDIGAAGYYADWFGDAFQMYVRYLFSGMTQRQAYESYYDYSSDRVWRGHHPDHPDLVLYLGWDDWSPTPQYNNAFAGKPDKTLAELFAGMRVSPDSITYLAESTFPLRSYPIEIAISASGSTAWTAALNPPAGWASLSDGAGISGETLYLQLTPPGAAGVYQTTLTITASDPVVQPRTAKIPVKIIIVAEVSTYYLPLALR